MKRVRSHVTAQVSAIHQQVQGALNNKNNNSSSHSSQGANTQGNSGIFFLLYSLFLINICKRNSLLLCFFAT